MQGCQEETYEKSAIQIFEGVAGKVQKWSE